MAQKSQGKLQEAAATSLPSGKRALPGLIGLAAFLLVGWIAVVQQWPGTSGALIIMAVLAGSVFLAEVLITKAHRRKSTGLNWATSPRYHPKRVMTKLVGITAGLGFLALLYLLLPEYHGSFYFPFWWALLYMAPVVVPLGIFYIAWVDARMKVPEDGLYVLGRFVMSLGRERPWQPLKATGVLLIVKGFFTPLMFIYLIGNLGALQELAAKPVWHQNDWFDLLWTIILSVDVGFAAVGYLCSFRLIDTHIRSCEPTPGGWVVAIICYQPFWSLISASYLSYAQPWTWGSLLFNYPLAYGVMAAIILGLMSVYAWATVSFGLRFSNLTYRGTVSWGPYRWTKHPAYLFKNTSWWLISLPFLPFAGWLDALQLSGLLLMLNGIYVLRAKTEERHLMAYADYRHYADWIASNGVLAKLKKRLPV